MRAIVLIGTFVAALATAVHAVDGVIEINQARAMAGSVTPGDTPGFPVTITQRGSYRLTGDLTPGATQGIHISADDVTIDLNGFSIVNPLVGILGSSGNNITVANGSILSATWTGLEVTGDRSRVERVRVTGTRSSPTGFSGIYVGTSAIVSGCTVSLFSGTGIVGTSGLITGNIVRGNGAGISLNHGVVTGNLVDDNTNAGLNGGAGYAGNTFFLNHPSTGVQVSGGLQLGPNMCNGAPCP